MNLNAGFWMRLQPHELALLAVIAKRYGEQQYAVFLERMDAFIGKKAALDMINRVENRLYGDGETQV
ncbi:MAG: hypothetical protein HC889_15380 [Synechococcaceae cyanobacterium SM1_2_3]|nr:hypothetical protein [Synechococcaceae cyanobacterium SM1_2_3]